MAERTGPGFVGPEWLDSSSGITRRACLRGIGNCTAGLALGAVGGGGPLLLPAPKGGGAPGAGQKAPAKTGLRGIDPWSDEDGVLAQSRIESYRRDAFAPLVASGDLPGDRATTKVDAEAAAACGKHAAFMAFHCGEPMGAADEDPSQVGFTPEGKAVAGTGYCIHSGTPAFGVDLMAMSVAWRLVLLDPALRTMSCGGARKRNSRHGAMVVSPGLQDRDSISCTSGVVYPPPGAQGVPLEGQPCLRDAWPSNGGMPGTNGGYPITAYFYSRVRLLRPEAKLLDARGKPVDCWTCAPGHPAYEKGPAPENVLALIPREVLRRKETYTAILSAEVERLKDERPPVKWSKEWKFTTAAKPTDFSELVVEYVR